MLEDEKLTENECADEGKHEPGTARQPEVRQIKVRSLVFFFFFGFSHEGKTVNVVKNSFILPSTAIFEN